MSHFQAVNTAVHFVVLGSKINVIIVQIDVVGGRAKPEVEAEESKTSHLFSTV